MAKNCTRTLIIGLGGTGQTVIREIKKRIFWRYGEIPPLVRFLAFETDYYDDYQDIPFRFSFEGENKETKRYNLQRDEFVYLPRPSLEVLKADINCQNLDHDQLEMLLALPPYPTDYRVLGRARFLYNAEPIIRTLSHAVTNLRSCRLSAFQESRGYSIAQDSVTVYIIASLAGGTGSSAIMDMSRMVQHAGIDTTPSGADTPGDIILGMFFMPAFFSTKPNTPNVKINTYVALSELEYVLGLSDRTKYPEGCSELEQDLNVYGDAQSYMPVRYSNVYLIDEKTRKGNSHSFEEVVGSVASFITASIAADNQALVSSYSNSTHRLHTVEGKSQIYSGLGYCEIRFERENLVKYLLNRQIRDFLYTYKSDESTRVYMDSYIESFLVENPCKVDDLTNSIFQSNDARFHIPLHIVKYGKEAGILVENSKKNYLDTLSAEAKMAIKEFSLKKKRIMTNLDMMLKEIRCQRGFELFPVFAKRLDTMFEGMKRGLEIEVAHLNQKKETMECRLEEDLDLINKNASSLFLFTSRRKEILKSLITAFSNKLGGEEAGQEPTLKSLLLEIARKEEAIRIYDEMIRIIDSYYKEESIEPGTDKNAVRITGSWQEIQTTYDALLERIESETSAYNPLKSAKNDTIFADAYFIEYFEAHPASELSEWGVYELYEYICNLLCSNKPVNNEMVSDFREFLLTLLPEDGLIKKIKNNRLSLDDLFVHCFGRADTIEDSCNLTLYPQLGLFKQLDDLFNPLWQYDDFEDTNSQPVARNCIVGVFDVKNNLFDRKNGYHSFIPQDLCYQFINLGDPDKIMFMLQETAIPAFKLTDAKEWERAFMVKKDFVYAFSDKRLEDIDMIMPEKCNETAEIAWAYGWLFGFIASVSGIIRVKPTTNYMTKNNAIMGKDGYYNYFRFHSQKPSDMNACHRKFLKDEELANDIYNQVMECLDVDKIGSIVRIAHWVNDGLIWQNRGKLKTSMDEQERLIIQNEPLYLSKRFPKLTSSSVSITYDEGRIIYHDNMGVTVEAEKAYKEANKSSE